MKHYWLYTYISLVFLSHTQFSQFVEFSIFYAFSCAWLTRDSLSFLNWIFFFCSIVKGIYWKLLHTCTIICILCKKKKLQTINFFLNVKIQRRKDLPGTAKGFTLIAIVSVKYFTIFYIYLEEVCCGTFLLPQQTLFVNIKTVKKNPVKLFCHS